MSQTFEPGIPGSSPLTAPSSPEQYFNNINLDYGLFDRLSEASSPSAPSPKRETSPSAHSLFSSDDNALSEDQREFHSSSALPALRRESPAFVDLTNSPTPSNQADSREASMANTRRRHHPFPESSSRPDVRPSSSRSQPRLSRLSTSSSRGVSSPGDHSRRSRKRRRVDSSSTEAHTRPTRPATRSTEARTRGIDTDAENIDLSVAIDVDTYDGMGDFMRAPQPSTRPSDVGIEEVDLTEVNNPRSLANALSKQREDAVKAQLQSSTNQDDEGRTILTAYKCPICMDVLEDATSTICGHLFCHRCIMDTLRFSEQQRAEESAGRPKGTCPVCRKPMARSDKQDKTRTLIPLGLKLQFSARKKGKGKQI